MKFFETFNSSRNVLLGSLVLSLIIIYPNVNTMLWEIFSPVWSKHHTTWSTAEAIYFIYRYLFFVVLTYILIRINVRQATANLQNRFWKSLVIALAGYTLYVIIGRYVDYTVRKDWFTQLPILQFLIAMMVPLLIGQIYNLTVIQREKEREIDRLRSENLQSRVDALTNQINPHFFFNSLNGITALAAAQKHEEISEYVAKLSNIFRYILQSDKKGVVKLEEELCFLDAYRYLIEMRYSGKICFCIQVPCPDRCLKLPVLSLLPLIENIVKHNIIDSEHKMTVRIATDGRELIVSNPIHRKYDVEGSNGIGLTNLSARYKLLTGQGIRVEDGHEEFTVVLPLNK